MRNYMKYNMKRTPEEFVARVVSKNEKTYLVLRWIYISLNILIILGSFVVVLVTSVIISHLVFKGWPIWYYYLSTSVAASITFVSSILNLLVVNKKMFRIMNINRKINAELAFYSCSKGDYKILKKRKEHLLFINVARILEFKIAIKEDSHDY